MRRAVKFTMRGFRALVDSTLLGVLLSICVGRGMALAPKLLQEAPQAGCALVDTAYHCDLTGFHKALASAHSIAIQTQPMDRMTAAQLRRLVTTLGKQLGTNSDRGTLLIALTPVEMTGITIGPGDHDLATLRVYALDDENRRGDLLWAETLRGQGDRPWPAQVHALIEQFQARLGGH